MKKWFLMVTIAALTWTGVLLNQNAVSADSSQVAVRNTATTDTTNGPRTMDSDIRGYRTDTTDRINMMTTDVTDNLYNRTYDRDVTDGLRMRGNRTNYRATAADNDMDWGWLGIFGLIGLAGLTGRNRNPQEER